MSLSSILCGDRYAAIIFEIVSINFCTLLTVPYYKFEFMNNGRIKFWDALHHINAFLTLY